MEENSFQKIEDEEIIEKIISEEISQDAFVKGLPDWDLEPLYESIDRGDN